MAGLAVTSDGIVLPFLCGKCGLSFVGKEMFLTHNCGTDVNGNPKASKFVCEECNKTFQYKASLRVHQKTLHQTEKQLKCPDCGKGFHVSSDLKRHLLTHSGERPYICTECDKGFTCKSSLHAHQKSAHTIGKFLQCPQCNKSFHLFSDLNRHERTHSGERPFICAQCKRGFTCKSSLKAHEKIHTIGKPFHCGFCEKSFHLQVDLDRHERTHTGKKPFKCDQCQKGFVCKSTLKTHQKLIHTQKDSDVDLTFRSTRKKSGQEIPNVIGIDDTNFTSEKNLPKVTAFEQNRKAETSIQADKFRKLETKRHRKSKFVQRLVIRLPVQ